MSIPRKFEPNWASPPGDTIREIVDHQTATQLELTEGQLAQLYKGRLPISDKLANRLEWVFGPSKQFWVNREQQYRETLARLAKGLKKRKTPLRTKRFPK